jgi:hypothetical protein
MLYNLESRLRGQEQTAKAQLPDENENLWTFAISDCTTRSFILSGTDGRPLAQCTVLDMPDLQLDKEGLDVTGEGEQWLIVR